MSVNKISNAILGVGVDDTTIDLFVSQYPVPTGVSYNSYVILDEKVAVLDTVDERATDAWLANLTEALADRTPDYLVVSHMEPDHGANIARLAAKYPEMKVVGNAKTFLYMDQFFGADAVAAGRRVTVKDGESLSLGAHTLTFVFAPMVHWPEVMVSYESSEKVLFSADGFGRFGAVAKFDEKADWASEARRYFLNIVGKYGPQVQALLKKAAALEIATICPLHGPVLTGDLTPYLNYYDIWSSYRPEEPEKILVAFASIHGHTRAAQTLAEKVKAGELQPEDITDEMMSDAMYTTGQKDPDFILRPSGEKRLSSFMLWQAAYSELVEMDVLWPDFTRDDLDAAIAEFNKRSRRFGGI